MASLRYDLPASLVVFLVALPLCLGIALASGAPPLAGLITGIIGGVVVAFVSDSPLAVSGPAAGLTTIVATAIIALGFEGYLLAVIFAGGIQIALGLARAGLIAYYFPSSVIKGMLAAIGLILIMKQFDHALGHDQDYEGNLEIFSEGIKGLDQVGEFFAHHADAVVTHVGHIHPGAITICAVGLVVLISWPSVRKKLEQLWEPLAFIPAPLIVVLFGIGLNQAFHALGPTWVLGPDHLVKLPVGGFSDLLKALPTADLTRWKETAIWSTAFTIAAVASIETLLCIEAVDKLDPQKRRTNTNRELIAQGVGNMLAGVLGGLPLTAVIVRGSANIQAGGRSKMSAVFHGVLLLAAVVAVPFLMNAIPLAALAAVLLHVGYKLARIELFKHMFRQPIDQWVPFLVTVICILATNLLKGVGVGMLLAIFFVLRTNLSRAVFLHDRESHTESDGQHIRLQLSENVSFLNRASVNRVLHELPEQSIVEIDGTGSEYIHPDVLELIHEFAETAHNRRITVTLHEIPQVESIGH